MGEKIKRICVQKIKEVFQAGLVLLYPDRCPVCDRVLYGTLICPECKRKLYPVRQPFCMRCGKQLTDETAEYCADCQRTQHVYTAGRGVFLYQGQLRRLLYRYKYGNRRDYTEFLAQEAYRHAGHFIRARGVELFVPIPLHRAKKRRRGYNQAELFARRLAQLCGTPVENALVRTRNTVPQKQLSDKERKNNLKNAFKIGKNVVKSKKILLIDDIYTTGSTIDAAASVLKRAGASDIYFLCISIGRGL